MREYAIKDNKYLIVAEDDKIRIFDLDKLFPEGFTKIDEGEKSSKNSKTK